MSGRMWRQPTLACPVVARSRAVGGDDLVEPADEVGQVLGGDGAVLDEGQGLGVAGYVHHQAKASLADVPDLLLVLGAHQLEERVAEVAAFQDAAEVVQS